MDKMDTLTETIQPDRFRFCTHRIAESQVDCGGGLPAAGNISFDIKPMRKSRGGY
ncbi:MULTISPECIES: hypothetical protein [Sphingomonas]|uniref:hypothetical protein n=1 Tax=Sphingomonas TaxID=13687 RepID=UPI0012E00E32|nr:MULTISPECIES: hypothetical protein [Sphingomonas]